MGLDITAYSKIRFARAITSDDPPRAHNELIVRSLYFRWRAMPVQEHSLYVVEGTQYHFRAGSYSGYGEWRDTLSQLMLHCHAKQAWERRLDDAALPFSELICFSDCEGVIGSIVAKKLVRDFARNQGIADAVVDRWWREQYNMWRQAFTLAADGGCVEFG